MDRSKLSAKYISLRQSIIEDRFSNLNDKQKEAALQIGGPLLILAGAGSGKTTVLIHRIIHILEFGSGYDSEFVPESFGEDELKILADFLINPSDDDKEAVYKLCAVKPVKPYEILAITFTNKAAKELRERLEHALGSVANDIWAHTFHTACLRILRSHIEKLGYGQEFTIYNEDDKKKVLKSIVRGLKLDEKIYDERKISGEIGRAKDNLDNSARYSEKTGGDYFKGNVAKIYEAYEKELRRANALDFDDIIFQTVRLLQRFPEVLAQYQRRFKYVLVDEYQDTNHAQYVLTSLLASGHRNICVVGDDDQSIYKFRGATITNILEFEQQYDEAKVIRLEQNYRSTQNILSAANEIISNNSMRKSKKLWTENNTGTKIKVHRSDTQESEGEYIAEKVLEGYKNGDKWSDFAVLYRSHVLSNNIENAFKRNSIPYKIVSGLRFFDRMEIMDVLAYLWVIVNPTDTLRLKRIVNVPARKIGDKTVEAAELMAAETGESLFQVIGNARVYSELSRAATALTEFAQMINHLRDMSTFLPLDEFYDEVLKRSGYLAALEAKDDMEARGRIENILELKSNILDFMSRSEDKSLGAFMEEISLFTDFDRLDESAEYVVMMTMHAAKGLEFPSVFLCGMEEDLFPSFRAKETIEDMEEERRLCYVAVTRAKMQLYLTCAERRMIYGQTKYARPSQFITEIDETHTDSNIHKSRAEDFAEHNVVRISEHAYRSGISTKPPMAVNMDFKVGQGVKHKAFGVGMITFAKPIGGDILLEINFEEKGTKKLMAKSAGQFMEKI